MKPIARGTAKVMSGTKASTSRQASISSRYFAIGLAVCSIGTPPTAQLV